MRRETNDWLYLPWNKIQSAAVFNAIFFIILQAYVGTATDDEVSCWAELPSMLSIFILIRKMSRLFVTFIKGFTEDRKTNHKTASLEPYWIFTASFPRTKCLMTKPLTPIEPYLEERSRSSGQNTFYICFKNIPCLTVFVNSPILFGVWTYVLKVNTSVKIMWHWETEEGRCLWIEDLLGQLGLLWWDYPSKTKLTQPSPSRQTKQAKIIMPDTPSQDSGIITEVVLL